MFDMSELRMLQINSIFKSYVKVRSSRVEFVECFQVMSQDLIRAFHNFKVIQIHNSEVNFQ